MSKVFKVLCILFVMVFPRSKESTNIPTNNSAKLEAPKLVADKPTSPPLKLEQPKLNPFTNFMYLFRKEQIAYHDANHAFYYTVPPELVKKFLKKMALVDEINGVLASYDAMLFVHGSLLSENNWAQIDCRSLEKFVDIPMTLNTGEGYELTLDHVRVCVRLPSARERYDLITAQPQKSYAVVEPVGGRLSVPFLDTKVALNRCGIKTVDRKSYR